jgi:pimeloyl-ACP methyl ester carboxylesterase
MGKAAGGLLSSSDRAELRRDPSHQQICWRRIMPGGILGWVDDLKAQRGEWGFDLETVTVPVTVRQGTEDKAVPLAHGEWLAEHLPNAKLQTFPEGHISIWDFDAILDDLITA